MCCGKSDSGQGTSLVGGGSHVANQSESFHRSCENCGKDIIFVLVQIQAKIVKTIETEMNALVSERHLNDSLQRFWSKRFWFDFLGPSTRGVVDLWSIFSEVRREDSVR